MYLKCFFFFKMSTTESISLADKGLITMKKTSSMLTGMITWLDLRKGQD